MRSLGCPDIVQQQLCCDRVNGQRNRKGLRDHHRKHTCRQFDCAQHLLTSALHCELAAAARAQHEGTLRTEHHPHLHCAGCKHALPKTLMADPGLRRSSE